MSVDRRTVRLPRQDNPTDHRTVILDSCPVPLGEIESEHWFANEHGAPIIGQRRKHDGSIPYSRRASTSRSCRRTPRHGCSGLNHGESSDHSGRRNGRPLSRRTGGSP
jgi:hypothetical protein